MQYKVPQNVDIEDKVIAGLTLRQFMFLMVAGGVVLMLKYVLVGSLSFLFLPIAILVGGFGIALAFVKINDRPFEIFLASAAKTLMTPSKRVWNKDIEIEPPAPEVKKVAEVQKKKSLGEAKSDLERLATIVDSGGAHETNIADTHMTNVRPKEIEDNSRLADTLAATEQKPAKLTEIMEQAKEYVGKNKREEPVSTMATVTTRKEDFKYDAITLSDEKKLEEILEKTEKKQKAAAEELANAKIEKFDHQG